VSKQNVINCRDRRAHAIKGAQYKNFNPLSANPQFP